jgi:hypothetical protein
MRFDPIRVGMDDGGEHIILGLAPFSYLISPRRRAPRLLMGAAGTVKPGSIGLP